MSKINNQAGVDTVVYPDFFSCLDLALAITRLPADRQAAFMRIASKAAAGCLEMGELNAVVDRIRAGTVTLDEGLAVLATAH